MISEKKKEEYFWRGDWTGQIGLMGLSNSAFLRRQILRTSGQGKLAS
ncbi:MULTISPECIES: hypothetical protein [unclassified Bradyrhizobium]|nr:MULTISPECIES: hypothetical protein [unclassified Bradyrhizobium]